MRIIAGKYRGRVLKSFRGEDVRPTADRVKESVFQILTSRIPSAHVLDLFSGSGALGIECLSRGAERVVFNDVSRDSIALLKSNLALVSATGEVMQRDFRACLLTVCGRFRLIFSDPPYKEDFLSALLGIVSERGLLEKDGLVIHEGERAEEAPAGWEKADERCYGRTVVGFFREIRA